MFAAVGIDTTPLTKEQRQYLPLLEEILWKLPATLENGDKLSKEKFGNKLHDETVYCIIFRWGWPARWQHPTNELCVGLG